MSADQFRSLSGAVEFYYDELKGYATKRTGSFSVAEDIVQDTWMRACNTSAAMPANPKAYVFRILSNLIVDHLRRNTKRGEVEEDSQQLYFSEVEARTPEIQVADRQQLAVLLAAIKQLPPKRRLVFTLYRGQGLTVRQIAERLDISESTVEKHVALALIACRKHLLSQGYEL